MNTLHQATAAIIVSIFSLTLSFIAYPQKSLNRQPGSSAERRISNPTRKIDAQNAESGKELTPNQIVKKVLPSVVLIVAQDEKWRSHWSR